jgi:hypothetical protein
MRTVRMNLATASALVNESAQAIAGKRGVVAGRLASRAEAEQ